MLPRSSRRYETYREHDSLVTRLRRFVGFLILVFLLYEAVTTLLVQSVEQESVAMEPTIERGERFFTLPLVYGPRIRLFDWILPGFRDPARGDLVALRPGYVPSLGFARRVVDPVVRFFTLQNRRMDDGTGWNSSIEVKRIVGVPGDTVRIERFVAYVRPAGEQEFVSEFALASTEYELTTDPRPGEWQPLDPFGPAMEDIELGPDEYFVLSDNRSGGIDARHWGPIDRHALLAKVSIRYWPLSRFGRP